MHGMTRTMNVRMKYCREIILKLDGHLSIRAETMGHMDDYVLRDFGKYIPAVRQIMSFYSVAKPSAYTLQAPHRISSKLVSRSSSDYPISKTAARRYLSWHT